MNTNPTGKSAKFWVAWTVAWAAVATIGLGRWAGRPAHARHASPAIVPASIRPAASTPTRGIEEIRPGDLVMARDDSTGEVAPRRVVQVFRNTADHLRIVQIRSTGGAVQELKTTDAHPFFVDGRGWVPARDLAIGDRLLQSDGRPATVASSVREGHPEGVPVFNFEVEGYHTYYVAEAATTPFVLVHNTCVAGEAGRFGNLDSRGVSGDGLTPHHMPQAKLGHTAYRDGGALMMPEAEHLLTRTYGNKGKVTAVQDANLSFRDVLAKDLRDVRSLTGKKYNKGMLDLLDYYRTNFPNLMKK